MVLDELFNIRDLVDWEVPNDEFKRAMRGFVGSVCVITVGEGEERSGLTATSVISLSAEPPRMLFCVNRSASAWPLLDRYKRFGINALAGEQQHIADRFAGRDGAKGPARYANADWLTLATGAPILADALVAFDCELEERIDRHTHSIIIAKVIELRVRPDAPALVYGNGIYDQVGGKQD
ncbi:hypothetical protein XM25_21625 [Devosia sp. H5989]|nr:hypothetical protein XM25_21625 [Devosia sp. H5989]